VAAWEAAGRRLVGRTRERDALVGLVRHAIDGQAGAVLVSGQAGVGKTALVREVCGRVGDEVDVLWASCLPLSSLAVPFLPLTTALREWAATRGGVVPVLDNVDDRSGVGPVGFDAWLDEACARRPVLLVVDDLQWADQSSLDVVMYLIAGPARRRLAMVATVRAGEADLGDPPRRWLADVRRLPRVEELILGLLDRPETGQQLAGILGRSPHQGLVDDVFARTRGNAYLTTLLARGLGPDATALPAGLPGQLREAVSRAWFGLSAPAREVTRLVAVAGRPQRAAQLRAVAPPDLGGRLVPLLREAVDGGVLEVFGADRYWFVHPLLAEVLADGLLPEERQTWHAAFAATLEKLLDGAEAVDVELVVDVADHHHRAGHVEAAYRWALRGAAAAERAGGAVESTRLLRRALSLRPRVADPGLTTLDLLLRIRESTERAGQHEEELAAVEDLLAVIDQNREAALVAELLVRRMHLRFLSGREFFEVGPMRDAVRLAATDRSSPQYALAVAELADAELWHGLRTGPDRAREAVGLARACGSDRALTYALVADVMARIFGEEAHELGEIPAGLAEAEEARAAARRTCDFFGFVHATLWAGNCMDYRFSRWVLEHLRRCRQEMTDLGAPHAYVAWLSTNEALGLLLIGEWRACEQRLRVALGATPGRLSDTSARLAAALLACWQGRVPEARAHVARAEELFEEQSGFLVLCFDAVRANLAVAVGDTAAAVAAARAGLSQDFPPDLVQWLLPLAARALADEEQRYRDRGGDPAPAVAQLDDLRGQYPQVISEPGPAPMGVLLVRATQALYDAESRRCRRDPDAGDGWQRAAAACHAANLAWDEAYAQWRAAQALLPNRASRTAGVAALRRAHELAVELQAAPLLVDIDALADSARVPLTPAPVEVPAASAPYGLTPRELEILGYVMAGRTYGEIARALVVSEKTISSHISNMLRKTGAANRVDLAQLGRRLNSAPPRS
jgi:DNA-binding CsgD family transcriptional regulator/tetratricopeptide (TPR) repeat protein